MMPTGTDRLAELLVDELDHPLPAEEEAELRRLLAEHPSWERDDMARAAAAAWTARALPRMEPLPDELRARILERAHEHLPVRVHALPLPPSGSPLGSGPGRAPRAGAPRWIPWTIAAAAALAAVIGWSQRPEPVVVEPAPTEEPTPAVRLAALKASGGRLLQWEASATEDPLAGAARGQFVWSPGRQEGFMIFQGLPHNDPSQRQYQLWIFDESRSAEHPVDGGVFDMPKNSAERPVVVPIDAALRVRAPTLFAVTVESPGGVVVSDREHIVVVGQPPEAL